MGYTLYPGRNLGRLFLLHGFSCSPPIKVRGRCFVTCNQTLHPSLPCAPHSTLVSLMFATMCHGTWNYLSEVEIFRPFLYRWRTDNQWLHAVGGWTMGFWIVVHVWLLFLPWLADGYKNVKVGGDLGWPLQVLPT